MCRIIRKRSRAKFGLFKEGFEHLKSKVSVLGLHSAARTSSTIVAPFFDFHETNFALMKV